MLGISYTIFNAMNKTLIVYGTRKGTTVQTAHVVSEILSKEFNHDVIVCDSTQLKVYKKRLHEFNNVIIGSSIVSGWWKGRVLSFAKKNIFNNKKVAVFVTAGGTLNKVNKYSMSKEEARAEAIHKYIDKYLSKFKFVPISKAAFGGRVVRREVVKYDCWNKSDIEEWAKELGDLLIEV